MFRKKKSGKLISLSIVFVFLLSLISPVSSSKFSVSAETDSDASFEDVISEFETGSIRDDMYGNYLELHKDKERPEEEIIVQAEDYTKAEEMEVENLVNYEGVTGKSILTDEIGSIEWEIDVPKAGLYNIAVRYFPVEGKSSDIERELYINGELPFQGAGTLSFPRTWDNELDEIESDNRDNHLRPRQTEKPIWMEMDLQDSEGYYTEPFLFYFNEGKNVLKLVSSREPVALDYLKIYQVEEVPTYDDVEHYYEEMGYEEVTNEMIKVQGEHSVLKSSPTLYAINDRSSPATEPYHVSKIRMNSIGGYNWRWPGQWITWNVDVPKDGLYKIGIKFKQNTLRGIYSTRKLKIDGKVPFKEMEKVPFYYNDNWDLNVLGNDDEPYLFYLTEGSHELTMEVTLGDMAPLLRTVEESVLELNSAYRQILMITGAAPDPYRDYQLEKNIPNLLDTFKRQSEILNKVSERLVEVTGEKSDKTAILNTMVYQLEDFIDRPETIQRRLDTYKTNVGSLGTWILTVREQPLEIDYLLVASKDKELPKPDVGFIRKAAHEIQSFFFSFIEDYNTIGNVTEDGNEEVKVWIGTGRDQAQVLKSMIDDTFTPLTGINVNLQLVDMGSLLPATLAGQGPDVAMQVGNETPVNYAMRNAVSDLTQFEDFAEVEERFRDSAVLPYRFDGGVYALPEQQVFSMLFYRKDIFEELELEVPQTWEDVFEIVPVLQKNHMEVALPLLQDPQHPGQVQNLIPNQTFVMMLYQQDGVLYQNNDTLSALDTKTSMEVFKQWTSLYTNYKLPLKFDFQNRFRTGEMPMGIADYNFYNTLAVAAPEIRGLWEFVPIPGTVQPDGSIRREVSSTGTGVVIMDQAENKEAAWEFLKWWTSKDVQVRFGREMEGLMGAAARYPTANIEALAELPWPVKDYQRLEEQWQWVRGVPEVPGGYFTGRHLDNAFREVVNNGTNPREALNDYIIYINDEIRAKRKEFNLPLE